MELCSVAQVAMRYWWFVACWVLLCAYPSSTFSAAGTARVVILLSEEGSAYREVAGSFITRTQQLAKKPPDIEIARIGDVDLNAWRGASAPQLVVTVGTHAAQVVFNAGITLPTLRVLIARNAHEALQEKSKDPIKIAATAIYLEQPWQRQIEFVRGMLPKANRIGIVLGGASQQDAVHITNIALQQNLMPLLRILSAHEDIGAVFKDLAEQSDVMLAVPDHTVLTPNSAKWLLYTAYQRGIPVVGFSKSYVSAGALGAVYSTPRQIGQHAAEIAVHALQEALVDLGACVYPKYFSVAVNRSVARSLRLDIPAEAELLRRLAAPEGPP